MRKLTGPKIGSDRPRTSLVAVPPRGQLEARRTEIASLPAWAGWQAERVTRSRIQVPGKGEIPYRPSGLGKLSPSERAAIEHHVACVEALLAPASGDDEVKLVALTKMLLTLSVGQVSEEAVVAKGEAYLHALRDVPAWAVVDAVGLWYDGKVKGVERREFSFPASPAAIAGAANDVVHPYREAIRLGRMLLEAVPLEEILA